LEIPLPHAAPAISVRIDDGEPVRGALVVVANTATYGGIMRVADKARCDSGRLEVVVLPRWSMSAMPGYAWAALRGRVSRLPGVVCRSGSTISITTDEEADCQADGEYLGSPPVTIRVRPRAATILVPHRQR
jgi:diacylglycerol kinase family enzyme